MSHLHANTSFAQTWANLEAGISRIMESLEAGMTYRDQVNLYTGIYNYCTSSKMNHTPARDSTNTTHQRGAHLVGRELYDSLRNLLKGFLDQLKSQSQDKTDIELLRFYTDSWEKFTVSARLLNHIFAYLNRHWVRREIDEGHKHIYEVYTLALVTWKESYFNDVHEAVMDAVLKLIRRQRDGETIDTLLIKKVEESFVSLGLDEIDINKATNLDVYRQFFEGPFIQATADYYKAESESFVSENSITDYLKKAETRLAEEEARVDMYLHASTHRILMATCENTLIKAHTNSIQEEFQSLLEQDKVDDLARMYNLLHRVEGALDPLKNKFEIHVRKQGLAAAESIADNDSGKKDGEEEDGEGEKEEKQDKEAGTDPKAYVDALLSVHSKYSNLVSTAFKSDAGFNQSMDRACSDYMNRNKVSTTSTKSPEMLAKYADSLLRKSAKVTEEAEVEEALNRIMTVFKYVEDKDVFQKFYSKMLAKRLVNGMSASDDAEERMLTKLKDVSGFEYTSKLSRMFTDMGISKDLGDEFRNRLEQNHEKEDLIDFNILTLSAASWPLTAPTTTFNIPDELMPMYTRFQNFYNSKHSGRKLTWLFNLCKAELKTNYLKTKSQITFTTSTYQMAILLMYNKDTSYSWDDILSSTGLEADTLKGQLGILVKARVLLMTGNLAQPGSRYELNQDFKSKKLRINLNMPVRSEQKQETEDTHKNVEEDRKFVMQAAIVRIMKTRKTVKLQDLMNEVIAQLSSRFKPQVSSIKKAIDHLIEKEYMERAPNERDTFNYMA